METYVYLSIDLSRSNIPNIAQMSNRWLEVAVIARYIQHLYLPFNSSPCQIKCRSVVILVDSVEKTTFMSRNFVLLVGSVESSM